MTGTTAIEHPTAPPAQGGRWALAGLALVTLLASLGTSVANVALPTLETAFGASFGQVQWVVLAYLLAVTTMVVGAGRLGDLVGRRRLLTAGVATFTVASAACAAAPALWMLSAARAVQGLGAAAMMALSLAFVAETVPPTRTGRAMGVLGSTSAIGTALGPSVGGVLITAFGWRAIFLVNLPLGLVAMRLVSRHLPADRRLAGGRPDVAGTLVLAGTLGAYALALTIGKGVVGAGLAAAAVGGGGLLVVVERRAAVPLVSAETLRDPIQRAGLLTAGLVSTVMMATLVVGPFYLSRALGLAPVLVGAVMSVGPAVVAVAGMPAGRIADAMGARRVTIAGLAAMTAGVLLLVVTPGALGVAGYLGPIVVTTVGYALFQTANNTAVMAGSDPERRGEVSGMLNLARNLGLITGASLMGAVYAFASGVHGRVHVEHPATGMRVTFILAAVMLLLATAIAVGARSAPGGAPPFSRPAAPRRPVRRWPSRRRAPGPW
ncbi:MAG: MFS transporter [Thermoleophilia bacterium]